MDLFTIAAKLTMDSSSFDSAVQSAESKGNKLTSSLNKLVSVAKKLAGAAVIGKAAKAMKNLADNAAAAGDKIDKQSQALGISRKAYQEWDYILSQSGSSIDSLGVSMKTLNNAILSESDSIDALGLSFEDLKDLNMEDQFNAVVKAFQQMPEGAEKSALAVQLFGRNGMELLPLLNSTTESVDELRQRFADLGLEMSDEQIDNAVKYQDTMDDLKRVFDAVKIAIASEFLPTLQDLAQKGAEYAGRLLKAFKEGGLQGVLEVLNTDLITLIDTLSKSGNPIFTAFAFILSWIQTTLNVVVGLFTDFDGTVKELKSSDSLPLKMIGSALGIIKDVLNWIKENSSAVEIAITAIIGAMAAAKIISFVASLSPLTLILAGIAAAATLIITNWDGIQKFFEDLWKAVTTAVTDAWKAVCQWWGDIEKSVSDAWNGIATWFSSNVWEPIQIAASNLATALTAIWGVIKTFLSGIWENIKEKATTVWEGIKTTAETVWNAIKSFITTPINAVQSTLAKTWNAITEAASKAWAGIVSVVQGIVEPISSAINSVIGVIQDVLDWLGKIFGFDGKTITITKIINTEELTLDNYGGSPGDVAEYNNLGSGAAHTKSYDARQDMGKGIGMQYGTTEDKFAYKGHFAKGEWNVPYDMAAMLHRNEMILTASQARRYREGEGGMDYRAIGKMIGSAVESAMSRVMVMMSGEKVGDLTTKQVKNNINAESYSVLRAMGG